MSLYLGLLHHPIKNKQGDLITTSVTNLDIHDIARSCRTYGLKKYYIITPLQAQQDLVGRILRYWRGEGGALYNSDRQQALEMVGLVSEYREACREIAEREGGKSPRIVVTGANLSPFNATCDWLRKKIQIDDSVYFLLFGTGWGIHDSLVEEAEFSLEPIVGSRLAGYNHLSVRSAVAIYLDRLLGDK